jgi:hypothetical protein
VVRVIENGATRQGAGADEADEAHEHQRTSSDTRRAVQRRLSSRARRRRGS